MAGTTPCPNGPPPLHTMQSPCVDACRAFNASISQLQFHGNQTHYRHISFLSSTRRCRSCPFISYNFNNNNGSREEEYTRSRSTRVRAKGMENVWSIDNEMAAKKEKERMMRMKKKRRKGVRTANRKGGKVMVSGSMLMEIETVLQTQDPVIRPAWQTFSSSVSGIWKGVGAVYSPITAVMEPVEIGSKNENLFDCYTLSHIEALPSNSVVQSAQLHRKVNWITLNPYGESKIIGGARGNKKLDHASLPKIESFEFRSCDVMEEDVMGMEPGLVFFEDGSYSRGPVTIPVEEWDESKYYISPTFKFEQCLVKCFHKRLRLVHTIEFSNGGSDIQILRVAVYEEEWVSPSHIRDTFPDTTKLEMGLQLFSQRKRVQPSDLAGSWKVFEVRATPIYGEDLTIQEESTSPYVYLCTENLNKRSHPETPIYFGEEEKLEIQDVTVLWLPGGVTAHVDVKDDVLCIGAGWYSDEGMNLVMERDYGLDGKLREVRWKTEMKRKWTNPPHM